MKRTLLLVVCLMAFSVHAASERLSPEAFTEAFRAALAAAVPDRVVTVVAPLHLSIKGREDEDAVAFLNNAYDQYVLDPTKQADVIPDTLLRSRKPVSRRVRSIRSRSCR